MDGQMDLLNGLISANAPISQQNAVGSYIEGNTAGQTAAKTKIENENALYQQNLQLRLQKSIQDSVNHNGSLNYNLLAINGAKNGIAPQMLDYMIKTLPAQWESLAKTAQSKMLLRTNAPSGYNEIQKEVNTKWSNQPVNKPAKTSTNPSQSSTKAAAVPSEDNSSNAGDSSLNNTDDGSTAKNYVYLTPDYKYTSNNPIKNVDGLIVNAGSQEDLAADTSGFVTPDMLQSNNTTTGGNNISEGNGQVNIGGSTLNPNAVAYDTLSPDLSTDDTNYGNQDPNGTQVPSEDNTQNTNPTNPFDIANKMDVINPSQMLGQGNGVGGENRSYFQVTNQTTDEVLNVIRKNLERNANLPKGARIDVINRYLKLQQDKDYAAVGPAPVLLPDAEGRYDYNDYGKRMQEWQKNFAKVSADWAEKFGKEYADQLTQQIAKDTNDRAELQLQNDATKYNNDINGRNQYAKEISATLGLGGTLDASTFGSIKEMQDFAERASAYKKLDTIPTNALGELGWAKNFIQAEGLGEAEGTMKLVQLLAAKSPLVRAELQFTYGGDFKSVGLQEIANWLGKIKGGELSDLKKEMKFPLDWKSHTGGTGLKPMRGTAPETTDGEMGKDPPKPGPSATTPGSDTIVKKGWYNSPAKATGDTFQTDNGNIYKVKSRGPVSGLPKTVIDDNGNIYKVNDRNPADPNAKVDLVPVGGASTSGSTPWSKRPANPKATTPKAKVPNKPSTPKVPKVETPKAPKPRPWILK